MRIRSVVVSFAVVALSGAALSIAGPGPLAVENWPQWRGPALNGVSPETGLPAAWSAGENIDWKLSMPAWTGSTPIVWEDSIFLNVSVDGSSDIELWRVNRQDGSVAWKRYLSSGDHRERKQNMSSPSPVTDGEHVWVMTGTGILKAFDFEGDEIWARDIPDDYWSFGLNWGYASSPLLHEDALYVQVLHGMKTDDPSYVLRLDKATGETVWMVERPTQARRESPDAYTTPALLELDGHTEIVITGGDVVTGHDPETGEELWRVGGLNPEDRGNYRIVASPVIGPGLVYAPSRERPMLAIDVSGRPEGAEPTVAWSFDRGPDVPTPVTDGELLYVVRDQGQAFALDARSGEVVYGPERLAPGTYSASPVMADGKIYVTNEEGVTTVYTTGPEFEILAQNNIGEYTLSSVAVAYGQIFLRTADALYAIGQGAD